MPKSLNRRIPHARQTCEMPPIFFGKPCRSIFLPLPRNFAAPQPPRANCRISSVISAQNKPQSRADFFCRRKLPEQTSPMRRMPDARAQTRPNRQIAKLPNCYVQTAKAAQKLRKEIGGQKTTAASLPKRTSRPLRRISDSIAPSFRRPFRHNRRREP